MKAGRLLEALPFAERAIAGQRACVPSHGLLATILLRLGRASDADAVVARAAELPSGHRGRLRRAGLCIHALGCHEHANALYRRATELAPDTPRFWYNLACSERSLGRLAEAEAACDRSHRAATPRSIRAICCARSCAFRHPRPTTSRSCSSACLRAPDRASGATLFLGYALAKELDDLERFDEAFGWFSEGCSSAPLAVCNTTSPPTKRSCAASPEVYPRAAVRGALRVDSSHYLFIVGLPRSGTTFVERILTGLPNVRSNGETENFSSSLLAATPRAPGDIFRARGACGPRMPSPRTMRGSRTGRALGRPDHREAAHELSLPRRIRPALPEAKSCS